MDLTASIRRKIEQLRNSKTTRYGSLTAAIEKDVATLTKRNAELFSWLEDALEDETMGGELGSHDYTATRPLDAASEGPSEDKASGHEQRFRSREEDNEEEDETILSRTKDQEAHLESQIESDEIFDDDEGKEECHSSRMENKEYHNASRPAGTDPTQSFPSNSSVSLYTSLRPTSPTIPPQSLRPINRTLELPLVKNSEYLTRVDRDPPVTAALAKFDISTIASSSRVSTLQSLAAETTALLESRHNQLITLRKKQTQAMKRLDKLSSDLEKISRQWEEEERERLDIESTSALGKRKRSEEGNDPIPSSDGKIGVKRVFQDLFIFGLGVVTTVGVGKFQSS